MYSWLVSGSSTRLFLVGPFKVKACKILGRSNLPLWFEMKGISSNYVSKNSSEVW